MKDFVFLNGPVIYTAFRKRAWVFSVRSDMTWHDTHRPRSNCYDEATIRVSPSVTLDTINMYI